MLNAIDGVWQWLAGTAATALLVAVSWVGRNTMGRIAALEADKANKGSTDVGLDRLDGQMVSLTKSNESQHRDLEKRMSEQYGTLSEKIDVLGNGVARIEGYIKGSNKSDSRNDRREDR